MYQSQTEITVEMEIRSKIYISNTRQGNRIDGMLLKKIKNKKMHQISRVCLHFINSLNENYGNKEPRYLRNCFTLGTIYVGFCTTKKNSPGTWEHSSKYFATSL